MRYKVQFEIITEEGTPAAVTVRPSVSTEAEALPAARKQIMTAFPKCKINKEGKPEAIRS